MQELGDSCSRSQSLFRDLPQSISLLVWLYAERLVLMWGTLDHEMTRSGKADLFRTSFADIKTAKEFRLVGVNNKPSPQVASSKVMRLVFFFCEHGVGLQDLNKPTHFFWGARVSVFTAFLSSHFALHFWSQAYGQASSLLQRPWVMIWVTESWDFSFVLIFLWVLQILKTEDN